MMSLYVSSRWSGGSGVGAVVVAEWPVLLAQSGTDGGRERSGTGGEAAEADGGVDLGALRAITEAVSAGSGLRR